MEIHDDGTFRVADKQADLKEAVNDAHPGSQEEWTYDGMVMTMQALESGVGERYTWTPNDAGVYFVRRAGDDLDKLKFEVIDDQCGSRMGGMMWGHWKPVTPET